MSYDIYFVRKKDINVDSFNELLELEEVSESDEIFISKGLKSSLKESIKSKGLSFETFDGDDDYLELNFPTFQVSMFNSQIAISIPYWDENQDTDISTHVRLIVGILLENGFSGYDPQTEDIISSSFEFGSSFTEVKTIVDKQLPYSTTSSNSMVLYIGIGLGIIILVLLLWKFIK